MIKVHYPHPPRQWDFYLGYLLWLGIMLSPIMLLFATWFNLLPLSINFSFALLLVAVCCSLNWRKVLEQYLIHYDYLLSKGKDISHELSYPPQALEEALNIVESLGFIRLGEVSSFAGLMEQPVITFYMTNSSQDISFEFIEGGHIKPYFARFVTWFEGNRLIETYYPVGDSIQSDDYRIEGINTSLDAACHYHIRQVAEFDAMYGNPIKQDTIATVLAYELICREKHRARLNIYPKIRSFAHLISVCMIISALLYWFIGYLFAIQETSLSLAPANMVRSLTMIYGGIALAVSGLVRMPSRSMKQAKKKSA